MSDFRYTPVSDEDKDMEIIEEKILLEQKWTLVKEKLYRDTNGKENRWSFIERRGRRKAAVIAATTEKSGSLIIIRQFRVPFGCAIYEFPAGLIDDGESVSSAAERELLEETGYKGHILEVSPEITSTSGLSTETVYMVYMKTAEEPSQKPQLEGSEQIEVIPLAVNEFGSFLEKCEKTAALMDAKLYMYLKGNSNS